MGPLEQGDYGNNYNQTIYSGFDPGKVVGFGGSGSATGGNEGGSGFGLSINPLQFISDTINTIAQLFTNKKNREFAAQQAQLQNRWNIEQWNRENAYNTPLAQMQRYIQAGLNPNLVVGQQNLAASSPQMVSGKDAPAGVSPRVDLGTAVLQAAQARNLDAQSNYVEQQSLLTQEQIKQVISSVGLNEANTDLLSKQVEYYQQCIENLKAGKAKLGAETRYITQQDRIAYLDYLIKAETFDAAVKSFQAQAGIDEEKARNMAAYCAATILGLDAQAAHYFSAARMNKAEEDYFQSLANGQWIQNFVESTWAFGNYYDDRTGSTRTGAEWSAYARKTEDAATANFAFDAADASTQFAIKNAELIKKYGNAQTVANIANLWSQTISNVAGIFSWRKSIYSADNPRMTAKTKIGAQDTRLRLGR